MKSSIRVIMTMVSGRLVQFGPIKRHEEAAQYSSVSSPARGFEVSPPPPVVVIAIFNSDARSSLKSVSDMPNGFNEDLF